MANKFRIGVSREVITKDGRTIFGEEATRILEDANVEWTILEDQPAGSRQTMRRSLMLFV